MSIFGKITSKGQTTVPMEIRTALGVGPGEYLEYVLGDGGEVRLRKAPGLESLRGIVKSDVHITAEELDQVIAMLRGRD
jgi:antitoxin PrlF